MDPRIITCDHPFHDHASLDEARECAAHQMQTLARRSARARRFIKGR